MKHSLTVIAFVADLVTIAVGLMTLAEKLL